LQGMHSDSNEVNIDLVDMRGTQERSLRTMLTTTNKGERFPFDTDFSIAMADAGKIVLRVSRSTLSVKKSVMWGELRMSGVIMYSNKPQLSAITEVVGKTLLPHGALQEQIYDPTRQDKRLSQVGLDALRSIKDNIRDETRVNRGAGLKARKAGTIAAGSGHHTSKYTRAQLDDIEEDEDSPEALLASNKREQDAKDVAANRFAAYQRAIDNPAAARRTARFASPPPSEEHSFDDFVAEVSSVTSGVVANEPDQRGGQSAADLASSYRMNSTDIPGSSGYSPARPSSIISHSSRFSNNNPFKPLAEAEEAQAAAQGFGRRTSGAIAYIPRTID